MQVQMLRNRSIGFRLTVWYAAILAGGLALFGGLVWFSLQQRLLGEIDRDLEGRAARFEAYFRVESAETSDSQLRDELDEFCRGLPPGSLVLRGSHGFKFEFNSGVAGPARNLVREFQLNGENFSLEVGAPTGAMQHTLDLLRLLLFALIPVVVAIAAVGGAWLSRRALKPVQDLTAAALTISIENLSERLPVPESGDELARLSEALNAMLARLEKAVQTLSQFVADASHELRTPLAVIRTTAELALRRARDAEFYRGSLREVVLEAERMTRLVEDLLILARSDAQTVDMPMTALDLREVLANAAAEMESLAEARQIRLRLSGESAQISGNEPALHRLFLLLLDNALKFSKSGSEVLLRVESSEDRVSATVQDFGTGIAAGDLRHIFERFYRGDPSRCGEGHGLGLALAQAIARIHGASIDVVSAPGEGSSFCVRFIARGARPGSANLQESGVALST